MASMKLLLFVFALVAVSISSVTAKDELHKFGSNPNQQCCGQTVIDPVGTTKACCAGKVYDTLKDTCCTFDTTSHIASGTQTGCCAYTHKGDTNYKTYDASTQSCCSGGIFSGAEGSGVCCGSDFLDTTDLISKSCCGDNIYKPADKTCCSGHLVDGADKSCCQIGKNEWKGYNAAKKTCCANGDLIKGGAPLTGCCNGVAYDPSVSGCCKNEIYDLANTQCCNGKTYDTTLYSCCNNNIINIATEGCCTINDPLNSDVNYVYPYTLGTQTCCYDKPIPSSYTCCGLNRGDHTLGQGITSTEQCCTYSAISAGLTCCHDSHDMVSHGYNANFQTCCSDGQVVKGGPSKSSCCDDMAYNPAKKTCCGKKLFKTADFTSPACCGGKPYDMADKICCGNKNLFSLSDFTSPSCCGSNAYDTASKSCCGTSTYKTSQQTCCVSEDGKSSLVSGASATCCGTKKAKGTGDACCGSNLYDSATEVCCSGNNIGTGNECCGSDAFDNTSRFCCRT